jgi:hypothetical protein
MRYVDFAKQEFKQIKRSDTEDNEMQDLIEGNILELLEVFSKQGHSGSSAPYVVKMFSKLAMFEPISPIEDLEEEWSDVDGDSYQNKRCSALFKEKETGKCYYLDAIIWREENDSGWNGSALDKSGKKITSRQYVNFPFYPKTFYVDVTSVEEPKDMWEFFIKDESQLEEVFRYYNRFEEK